MRVLLGVALAVLMTFAAGCSPQDAPSSRPVATSTPAATSRSPKLDKVAFQQIGERAAANLSRPGDDGPAFVGVLIQDYDGSSGGRAVTFWFSPGPMPDGQSFVMVTAPLVAETVAASGVDLTVRDVEVVVLGSGSIPLSPDAEVTVGFERAAIDAADWPRLRQRAQSEDAGWLEVFRAATGYSTSDLVWDGVIHSGASGWPSAKQFPQSK